MAFKSSKQRKAVMANIERLTKKQQREAFLKSSPWFYSNKSNAELLKIMNRGVSMVTGQPGQKALAARRELVKRKVPGVVAL